MKTRVTLPISSVAPRFCENTVGQVWGRPTANAAGWAPPGHAAARPQFQPSKGEGDKPAPTKGVKRTADSQDDKKPKINNQVERVEESAPGVPVSLENQTQPRTNPSWKKQ